ncbi:MAG: cytochrome c-type biogenesis protein [Rickettsiales bacterium]
MKIFYKALFLLFLFTQNSLALSTENRLTDPALEARAMNLFLIVKCMVCNGQVIENSDTKFAHDLRQYIRQKITDGLSDEEIKSNLIEKFGDEILMVPQNSHFMIITLTAIIFTSLIFFWFFKLKKTAKKL